MDIFLKNKQFRQISFANFFSMIGDKMFYLAMLTYVSTLPHAQIAIGLVTASELIPQMFSSYTGYRADTTQNRGRYIIISDFIRVILYLLVGLLFVSNLSGWMILIGIALLNLVSDFFGTFASGLRQPLIVSVTGKEDFAEASGFTQGMSQTISVLAQFVGASLLIVLVYSQLAFLNALTFFISGCIMVSFFYKNRELTTKQITVKTNEKQEGFFKKIGQSLKLLRNEDQLLGVILTIVVLNSMLSSLTPIIQMLIVNNEKMLIHSYSFTIASLNSTISISLALGGFLGTKYLKKFSLKKLIFICLIATSIFYPVVLTNHIYGILIILVPICFLVGTIVPKLSGWIVQIVDEDKLAMTVGMLNTLLIGLAPLTTFLIVMISSLISPIVSIILLFVLSIILIFFEIFSTKEKQKERIG